LTARLVFARTWLSLHRGDELASDASRLDLTALLALALALGWALWVSFARWRRARALGALDAGLVGIVLLCGALCAIPSEQWKIFTAQAQGARRVPKDWIVWSAARGETRLLGYLLTQGADPDARTPNGLTALGAAAAEGRLESCELLIAHGAHLDRRSGGTQQTPLIEAAQQGRLEVARLLLAHGADPAARDFAGLSAEDWAQRAGDEPMVRLLQRATRRD
jgi:hypothetical protein